MKILISNYVVIKYLYATVFFIVTLSGLFAYGPYNYLPVRPILELFFFALSLFVLNAIRITSVFFFLTFLGYVVISYFYMEMLGGGGVLDFLVIFKSFIYFIFLCFFLGKQVFDIYFVERLFFALLLAFLLKYALWLALGISARPGIYGENNFELIFLLLMYICHWSLKGKISVVASVLVGLVFLLSGSRSGVVALFAVLAVLSIRKLDYKFFVSMTFLGVVGLIVFYTFAARMTEKGLSGIDRYVFFLSFLNDVSDWRWYDFVFGSSPITPMSGTTCEKLSFYKSLFSYYDASVCYSVILHSFVLRTIYDHGFVGLFLLLFFVFYGLKVSGYSFRQRLCVVGVLFLTGLSVSSINSIFVAMSLLIMCAVKRPFLRSVG